MQARNIIALLNRYRLCATVRDAGVLGRGRNAMHVFRAAFCAIAKRHYGKQTALLSRCSREAKIFLSRSVSDLRFPILSKG